MHCYFPTKVDHLSVILVTLCIVLNLLFDQFNIFFQRSEPFSLFREFSLQLLNVYLQREREKGRKRKRRRQREGEEEEKKEEERRETIKIQITIAYMYTIPLNNTKHTHTPSAGICHHSIPPASPAVTYYQPITDSSPKNQHKTMITFTYMYFLPKTYNPQATTVLTDSFYAC